MTRRNRLLPIAATTLVAVTMTGAPPAWAASTTDLISRSSGGARGSCQSLDPQSSANGRLIVFSSCASNFAKNDDNGSDDVFLRNRTTGKLLLISQRRHSSHVANGASSDAAISGDGRFIAFVSSATDLVAGDGNNFKDVFRYDTKTDTMLLVSRTNGGHAGN